MAFNSLLPLLLLCAALQADKATITGVVRLADGKPAIGVRVAAMVPDAGAVNATELTHLTQTNEFGRYRLEDVDPGSYYIVAGRVDAPTYYPGGIDPASATLISVVPGTVLRDLDFTVAETSVKPQRAPMIEAFVFNYESRSRFRVPVRGRVVLENNGDSPKLPETLVFTILSETNVQSGRLSSRVRGMFNGAIEIDEHGSFTIMPWRGQSNIRVSGLPPGYSVKSITAGQTDLSREDLDTANASGTVPDIVITLAVDASQRED